VHRTHQEVSGSVAGEHASGTIGAVGRWREAEHEHARMRISKSRYRLPPVSVLPMSGFLVASDAFAVRPQPRAARAGDDLTADERQGRR
jgi:hypothetical protein